LHFEVCLKWISVVRGLPTSEAEANLFSIFSFIKLNESILQRVPSLLVPDNLTAHDGAKPRKDKFEILITCYRVKLAYKQHIFRGSYVREGEVSNHFEGQSRCCCGFFASQALFLLFRECSKRVFVLGDPSRVVWWPRR